MASLLHRVRLHAGLLLVCCGCLAGCAGIMDGYVATDDAAPSHNGQIIPVQAATQTVAIGASTKADVMAALGKAIVIPFDNGYEVWVYRWRGSSRSARAATELVILFSPSGVVRKVRVRPGYEGD